MRETIKKRLEQVRRGIIPAQYKTKFGISPLSWKDMPLKTIAKKRTKKNFDNGTTTVFSNTALYGVIKQTDYFEKDIANIENIDSYYIVEEGDFVYNPRISSMAPYGPIHANELGMRGIVSPLYTVFYLNNSDLVDHQYLKFYFDSSQWNKYMYSIANYGARHDRMNIADNDFFNLPIPLPLFKEQQKVAEILNHCDKVIRLKQRLIEEEFNHKKWLMQNLLDPDSGLRLPGLEGFWRNTKFGNIVEFIRNGYTYDTYFNSFGVKISRIETISKGKIDYNSVGYISNSDELSGYQLEYGDILFSHINSMEQLGKTAFYDAREPLLHGMNLLNIRAKKSICLPEYLYYLLNSIYAKKMVWRYAKRAIGQCSISATEIKKHPCRIPYHIEEQKRIVDILIASENIICNLEQELGQWQQKKKALMQLLLTGLVRVNA